jgi:methylthioribose-1-phosphate isomerase
MKRVAEAVDEASLVTALEREALAIFREDYEANQRMGEWGASLLSGKVRVLTHCNTGSLATAGWGTALGVIRTAHRQGKIALVWVDETRPFLQGARLTMWELRQEGIPAKLIVDGAAAWVMRNGWVDAIFVGADRIARSGDVANKIGTYMLAVVAHHHGIPFYVVAPTSTIDLATPDGNAIPIEERHPDEVRSWGGVLVAPEGSEVFNPAFDVTPAELVTAIVTEQGIAYPPFEESLAAMVTEAALSRR